MSTETIKKVFEADELQSAADLIKALQALSEQTGASLESIYIKTRDMARGYTLEINSIAGMQSTLSDESEVVDALIEFH